MGRKKNFMVYLTVFIVKEREKEVNCLEWWQRLNDNSVYVGIGEKRLTDFLKKEKFFDLLSVNNVCK